MKSVDVSISVEGVDVSAFVKACDRAATLLQSFGLAMWQMQPPPAHLVRGRASASMIRINLRSER